MADAATGGGDTRLGLATLGAGGSAPRDEERAGRGRDAVLEPSLGSGFGAMERMAVCDPGSGGLSGLGLAQRANDSGTVVAWSQALVAQHPVARIPLSHLGNGRISGRLGPVRYQLARKRGLPGRSLERHGCCGPRIGLRRAWSTPNTPCSVRMPRPKGQTPGTAILAVVGPATGLSSDP